MMSVAFLLLPLHAVAENRIYVPQVKSLQAVVNQDWLSPAVMRLHSDDQLHVSFDELSHDHHRYLYRIERCEADWSAAEEVFESDWLEGFNDNIVEDYQHSINTVVPYTHYSIIFPNERCQLTTNTDIDVNQTHQQLTMGLRFCDLVVSNPEEQLQMVITQNGQRFNKRQNIRPTSVNHHGLEWQHCRDLIFDAGNEYRKYEILDTSHPTMGIEHITWDGTHYQAFPFIDEPRPYYIYDQDADGAFYIRNSDNREN